MELYSATCSRAAVPIRAPVSSGGSVTHSCSGWQSRREFCRWFEGPCPLWECWMQHGLISRNWLPTLSAWACLWDSCWVCFPCFDHADRSSNSALLGP